MLACALAVEERAARRAGARVARVGLGAKLPLPQAPLVSFGVAGALAPDLEPGALVTATRVVDAAGAILWEGDPLLVGAARPIVLASIHEAVDDPDARVALARATGAAAVDLESAALAVTGRLVGVVRVVSDSAREPIGRVARAARPDGGTAWLALALALLREPRRSTVAMRNGRRALLALERAAAELAPHGVEG